MLKLNNFFKNSFLGVIFILLTNIFTLVASGFWNYIGLFNGGKCDITFYFSIGSKGYVGGGRTALFNFKQDFWEFDPIVNSWTQKANYIGGNKGSQIAFTLYNKGYVGLGFNGISFFKTFYEYDPILNLWTQKATFPGSARYSSIAFELGNFGYIGTGYNGSTLSDFWQYNPITNHWIQKNNFPGSSRQASIGFTIDGNGYILGGFNNGSSFNDLWQYEPSIDLWNQMANLPGPGRRGIAFFTIKNHVYAGLGFDNSNYLNDFYSFDPNLNQWIPESNFPGQLRYHAFCYSIGNTGYLGTGSNGPINSPNFFNDVWEFIPGSTSVSETKEIERLIWYNTNTNEIIITYNDQNEKLVSFQLYNSLGKIIQLSNPLFNTDNYKIKIPNELKTGIYFYSLQKSDKSISGGKIYISPN